MNYENGLVTSFLLNRMMDADCKHVQDAFASAFKNFISYKENKENKENDPDQQIDQTNNINNIETPEENIYDKIKDHIMEGNQQAVISLLESYEFKQYLNNCENIISINQIYVDLLICSCWTNHVNIIRFFLEQPFELTKEQNPLIVAIEKCKEDTHVIKILLEDSRIDPNAYHKLYFPRIQQTFEHRRTAFAEHTGHSPLLTAIKCNRLDIVKLLSEHPKIDMNDLDSSYGTPLYCACNISNLEIVKFLMDDIRTDPEVNIKYTNLTIFQYLCVMRRTEIKMIEIVEYLVNHQRIDIHKPNKEGIVPLDLLTRGYSGVIKKLIN